MVELSARARALFTEWSERAGAALVDEVGTVVSGAGAATWATAVATAGTAYQMMEVGSRRCCGCRRLPSPVRH